MKRRHSYSAIICRLLLPAFLLLASCSTTKTLTEGQLRLAGTKITVTNDKKFNTVQLNPYLRQQSGAWSPFIYVYNWENGKGKGWDKFVHKLGTAPVIYDSTLVGSSIENLKEHLQYLGYYDSQVDTSTIRGKNPKNVKVNYYVRLGKRYPIRDIRYEIPRDGSFRNEFFADTSASLLKKGCLLSEKLLDEETERSAHHLRDLGYFDFTKNHFYFEADTVSHPDSARLKVLIKHNTRNEKEKEAFVFSKYQIGKVSASYPSKLRIRQGFLSGLNNIESGSTYNETAVNTLYQRYSAVGLFTSVNIQMNPDPQTHKVDCDISLRNSKIHGFKLGLEASVNSSGLFGVTPEFTYYNKNIFRGGERLTISFNSNHQIKFGNANISSNEFAVSAGLLFPKFLPFPAKMIKGPNMPNTEVNFSFNYQERPEYIRTRFKASFGWSGNLRRHFSYNLTPISVQYVRMPRIESSFENSLSNNPFMRNSFQDQLDAGLHSVLYYSSSTEVVPSTSYWYGRFQFNSSGNLLRAFNSVMRHDAVSGQGLIFKVPYAQYVRAELTLGKTFIWGRKMGQSFAMRAMVGIGHAYGNSIALPFEQQFYAGGANSMRGWNARTLGPGAEAMETKWVIPNQTGNFKFEANVEYRFRLFWKIAGALFVDVGNIWNIGKSFDPAYSLTAKSFLPTIAADWGAGLRLDLSLIVLRVDLGLRLRDPARAANDRWVGPTEWFRNDNYCFHFGVGLPF